MSRPSSREKPTTRIDPLIFETSLMANKRKRRGIVWLLLKFPAKFRAGLDLLDNRFNFIDDIWESTVVTSITHGFSSRMTHQSQVVLWVGNLKYSWVRVSVITGVRRHRTDMNGKEWWMDTPLRTIEGRLFLDDVYTYTYTHTLSL